MKRTIKVDEGKTEYTFDDQASFVTQKGQKIEYVGFSKVQRMRDGKPKFQSLTVAKKNWGSIRDWLLKILADSEA